MEPCNFPPPYRMPPDLQKIQCVEFFPPLPLMVRSKNPESKANPHATKKRCCTICARLSFIILHRGGVRRRDYCPRFCEPSLGGARPLAPPFRPHCEPTVSLPFDCWCGPAPLALASHGHCRVLLRVAPLNYSPSAGGPGTVQQFSYFIISERQNMFLLTVWQ